MDVGNDPFPRDEVTGLAAFENLEPVSALNVMPEPPPEPPPQVAPAPRTFNRPLGVSPTSPGAAALPGREDKTEILDLAGSEPVGEDGYGWDDEEATSILSSANLPGSHSGDRSAPPAASLDMDWDEEEPPTRMRDDMAFLPPLGGRASHDEASWDRDPLDEDATPSPDLHYREGYEDAATAAFQTADIPASVPAPPLGRPSPFPSAASSTGRAYLAPIAQPIAQRGGAPSPFTTTSTGAETWDQPPSAPSRPAWMLVAVGAAAAVILFLIGRALIGPSASATVSVATEPSDARVYIDGRPVPGTSSPYSFGELAAGSHELVVQKDGFGEHRSTFTLEGDEARTLPEVKLAAKKTEAGFAVGSMPSGAEIWIDGQSLGKQTPAQIRDVSPGVHTLELKLAGHEPFQLQVLVPESSVLQLPIAQLAAAPSGSGKARASAESKASSDDGEPASARRKSRSERSSSSSEAADEPAPKREREPVAAAAPAASSGGAGGGMLRLNSRPWSQVYVDGKLVGNTPQMGLPLSPGNHSVRLVNSQMGLSKTFSVSVKTGQMITKVVNLVD